MAGSIFRVFDNGEGTQIAVGASGLLITSTDGGATWVTRNSGTGFDLYGAAYGVVEGVEGFVVVGAAGTILTSADAISWIPRISFTSEALYDVAYNGVFLAVGASGAFGLSDDLGATWEAKASGTLEDLVSIVADLGAYLITGTNDTVITGEISSLQFDILVVETVRMTPTLASQADFNDLSIVENLTVVSEESWEHDALGAGTTITIGGTNQFIWLDESLILTDDSAQPTGSYNMEIIETVTMIDSLIDEHNKNTFGDLIWPMFEVEGVILAGGQISGDLLLPMFEVSGRLTRGLQGDLLFPMFEVAGIILPNPTLDGDLLFPMFIVEGLIAAADRNSVTTDYAVWVLNSESAHHSTYTKWQVNSLNKFNGEEIAAMPGGLFRLTGEDDAGEEIEGKIYWAPSDLTTSKQKALEAAFIRMRGSNGAVRFVTIHDETEIRVYRVSMRRTSDGNMVRRVPLPRGLQANLWQFGIESVGYGKLDLFEIEVTSVELDRKLR